MSFGPRIPGSEAFFLPSQAKPQTGLSYLVAFEIRPCMKTSPALMKRLLGSLTAIGLAAPTVIAFADTPAPSLAGTWQYRPRGLNCTEQYFFRTDGTVMVTSHKEVTESSYALSAEALPGGFYQFDTQVTQTNGNTDCRGNQTPVGLQSKLYLRFQANGERFVLCRNANLSACMGPMIRLKGRIGA